MPAFDPGGFCEFSLGHTRLDAVIADRRTERGEDEPAVLVGQVGHSELLPSCRP